MLMRVQEAVDYNHVPERHAAIHARLENWRKWLRPRASGWHTHPMWKNALTSKQWDVSPSLPVPINTLDAVVIEKAVAALPCKHRDALRWCYVHTGNPIAMARNLGVSKQGLADLVSVARTMLINTVSR